MDIFDFGSPALQAMSVPAILVLLVLAVITLRSAVRGEVRIRRPGRDTDSGAAQENVWRGARRPTV